MLKDHHFFFDWYECGVYDELEKVVMFALHTAFDSFPDRKWRVESASTHYGYKSAWVVTDKASNYARLMTGGNTGQAIYLKSTGLFADSMAIAVRKTYHNEHHVMRVDVACDFVNPEFSFLEFSEKLSAFCEAENIMTENKGDWSTARKGRSLYCGSRSSVAMLRYYEKSKQIGSDDVILRFEMEIKPQKPEKKLAAALLSKVQLFASAKVGSFLLDLFGVRYVPQKGLAGTWQKSDKQRALEHCLKQYSNTLAYFAAEDEKFWDWFIEQVAKKQSG